MLFLFNFKSGPVPNRRPSLLPEHGLFLPVFLPGEDITKTILEIDYLPVRDGAVLKKTALILLMVAESLLSFLSFSKVVKELLKTIVNLLQRPGLNCSRRAHG